MRRVMAVLGSMCCVTGLFAQPVAKAGTQHAFLVACASYHDRANLPPLPHTVLEMDEFRVALEKSGFDSGNVKFVQDSPKDPRFTNTRESILKQLKLLLGRAEADDTVLLAFAGHGVHFKDDAHGYFCPINANILDKTTLIAMEGDDGVFDLLKACKAKRKLLIVNACRNDPVNSGMAARKLEFDNATDEEVPEGIAAIYSCKAGQKSFFYPADSPHKNRSLFFHHLIEAWGGKYTQGPPTLEEVFAQVKKKTALDADSIFSELQVPQVRREYKGEWKIAASGKVSMPMIDPKVEPRPNEKNVVIDLGDGVKMEFALIPAGKFWMGSPKEEPARGTDEDQVEVEITKPFYMAKYETTQAQWKAIMNVAQPLDFKGDAFPVEATSWEQVQRFAKAMSEKSKSARTFRLPTEAEWEYACRGGAAMKESKPFHFNDGPSLVIKTNQANFNGTRPYNKGAIGENRKATVPVGSLKSPNLFGLHDMHGNVWEWCQDLYGALTGGKDPYRTTPTKEVGGRDWRVMRGGWQGNDAGACRAASRSSGAPTIVLRSVGCRLVMVP